MNGFRRILAISTALKIGRPADIFRARRHRSVIGRSSRTYCGGSRNRSSSVEYSRVVDVSLRDGSSAVSYNAVWLRENCRCEQCFNANTSQRAVLHHHLPPEALVARRVTTSSDEDPDVVEVTWADGHQSRYSGEWLNAANRHDTTARVSRCLWDSTLSPTDLPPVDFNQLMDEEGNGENIPRPGLTQLLSNLLCYGLAFVDNTPNNLDDTMAACRLISFPQRTLFGECWQFGAGYDEAQQADAEYADTAYTSAAIGVHNDGTYFTQPPGLQVLNLVQHDGDGGETVLVDGFRAAQLLRERDPAAFNLLTKVRLEHHYHDPIRRITYQNRETVIRSDSGHTEWIRYNPYDRSAAQLEGPIYQALGNLGQLLEGADAAMRFKLEPGRMLVFDNWRVLHGRTSFSGRRELCGCYMPRDEWLCRARQLELL